jgi:hypothetical protein
MPSNKRLKSVCHSIAHHAVSSLSYVHPHLRRACNAIGVPCARINLKAIEPCPEVFRHIEPLRLSLSALREKFESILTAEGFTFADIESVDLTFYFTAEFPDDYCSICDAEILSAAGRTYRYVVDHMGDTRAPNNALQSDCLQRWRASGNH